MSLCGREKFRKLQKVFLFLHMDLRLAIFFEIGRKSLRDLRVDSVDVNTACKRLQD